MGSERRLRDALTTGHAIFAADEVLTDRVINALETLNAAGDRFSEATHEWVTGHASEIWSNAPTQASDERIKRQRARAYDLHVQLLHALDHVSNAVGVVAQASGIELPGPTAADYDEQGRLR